MATNKRINQLKATLGHGARANKYRVVVSIPKSSGSSEDVDVLAKTATVPERTVGVAPVWTQGRKISLAGDEAYSESFDVEFYLLQDHSNRDIFNEWMNEVDNYNAHNRGSIAHEYMSNLELSQLDTVNGEVLKTYNIMDVFPISISELAFGSETNDEVSVFTVTFAFSSYSN